PAPRGGRRGAALLARSRRALQPPGARGRPAVQPAARRGDGLRPVPLPRRPCGALPRPPAGLGGGGGGEPPVRAGGFSRPRSADGRPPPHFHGQDAPLPGAVVRGVPRPACGGGLRERAGAGRAARARREEGAGAPAPGEPQGAERLGRRLGGGPAALPLGERHHAAPGPLRRGGELLMLEPDTSVLLTDALRPPPGHEVDVAVTTTYSLNLTAMLIAPTTFALASMDEATRIDDGDPAQLLDAVQRFMGRTTVFCQAAGIHVPRSHSPIHTFLEESLHAVEAPREGALVHPKLCAIRYRRAHDGACFHRVVGGSRNLTLDSSWDTALVLDESSGGTIDAAPAATAVEAMTGMVLDPLAGARQDAILDLARSLRDVRLEAPEPFTGGRLLALGLGEDPSPWPFPERARKVLAISPFLSAPTLARLRSGAPEATLLTRAPAADLLGGTTLSDWDVTVLDPAVDGTMEESTAAEDAADDGTVPADDFSDPSGGGMVPAPSALLDLSGLHAKTVVADGEDGRSVVVTGSANLTAQAWGGNVEFDAVLTGPTRACGVDAVLDGPGAGIGLRTL